MMLPYAEYSNEAGQGIEQLYAHYQRSILAYLMKLVSDRETAEDLCQDTFVKALRNWDQHKPEASSSAWLYRIATNTAYDHLRRRRRIHFTPLLENGTTSTDEQALETQFDEGEAVQAALAKIPPHYRRALLLHTCEGHSIQEIAEALGCTQSTVKTRLFRARERFREVYQG